MTLPTTKSNFPSKCKKCGIKYEKGVTIYKINEEYWCSDSNCTGEPKKDIKTDERSIDLEAKLDQIWDICYKKADAIMKETFSEQDLIDKFQTKKQTLIIAQTFVKALCGNGD